MLGRLISSPALRQAASRVLLDMAKYLSVRLPWQHVIGLGAVEAQSAWRAVATGSLPCCQGPWQQAMLRGVPNWYSCALRREYAGAVMLHITSVLRRSVCVDTDSYLFALVAWRLVTSGQVIVSIPANK